MAGESISIPILTPGADTAARNIKQVGDAAAGTGAKLGFAAGSLETWNRAAANSAKADATSVNALKAHAKATTLLADAENVLAGKATTTTKLFADQQKKLDDSGKSATTLASRFSALAGTGGGGLAGGGMGALIGAGIALSGQLTAVGFGLAGLAGAAYGVIKPITTAAQATGGLQKNLHTLNPEQQTVAKSLLALGKQYDAFQKSLAPQVLTAFNDAFRIAGHVMSDVQPIAKQTGNALNQVLLSVDKEFQSGTWQQFFRFLAQQAGPDVRLLGQNFNDLLQALPPLIQQLTPLGNVLLHVSDDAFKAAGGIAQFYKSFQQNVPISNEHTVNALRDLDSWVVKLTDHLGPWARAINNSGTAIQQNLGDKAAHSVGTTAAQVQRLSTVTGDLIHPLGDFTRKTGELVAPLGSVTQLSGVFGDTTGRLASKVLPPTTRELEAQAKQLNILAGSYEGALTPLGKYIGATLTEHDDLKALNVALRASGDTIGYKTQKERDSFASAQTYIDNTIKQGNAALAAHKGIDAQITSLENALPALEHVKGKTSDYRDELNLLRQMLDRLRAERNIQEKVLVTGDGSWRIAGVAGKTTIAPRAAGGMITGGHPGRDSVLASLMPGEVVVPTRMVASGAVDHLRGSLPGFASGGVVGSYSGSPAGLPPWTQHNWNATITSVSASIAASLASSIKQALAGAGAAGPGGGAPAANAALARRLYASQLTPASWEAWNAVAMAESGWNQFARNPSSGAYGIPQALPPGKMGAAANPPESNPTAQINWMWNYMRASYGGPLGAEAHENAFHWYDKGGWLPTGTSIAVNNTGHPEQVIPGGKGRGGNTYHITVNVPPNANKAEYGRLSVEAIKEFERRSGAGWRS